MGILAEEGITFVGPAARAATALIMTAQTPVSLALIGPGLSGRRDADALAGELLSTWGAPSLVLSQDPDRDWRRKGALVEQMRAALATATAAA